MTTGEIVSTALNTVILIVNTISAYAAVRAVKRKPGRHRKRKR